MSISVCVRDSFCLCVHACACACAHMCVRACVPQEMEWRDRPMGCGTGIFESVYRKPHLTDVPPVSGIAKISVREEVEFHDMHKNGSFPKGWPYATTDVLHDEHDEVVRVMQLNERLLIAAEEGDIEVCVSVCVRVPQRLDKDVEVVCDWAEWDAADNCE